jgi:hypothetical protein
MDTWTLARFTHRLEGVTACPRLHFPRYCKASRRIQHHSLQTLHTSPWHPSGTTPVQSLHPRMLLVPCLLSLPILWHRWEACMPVSQQLFRPFQCMIPHLSLNFRAFLSRHSRLCLLLRSPMRLRWLSCLLPKRPLKRPQQSLSLLLLLHPHKPRLRL